MTETQNSAMLNFYINSYSDISTPKQKITVQKIRIRLEPQVYRKLYNIVPYPSGRPSKNQDLYETISMPYSQPLFREVVNDEDHENILLLALHALPQQGDGAVLMPRRSPPRPLPPLQVSIVRSSAGEGRETMMTTMMIREAMTTPTVSDPVRPTHNNQP